MNFNFRPTLNKCHLVWYFCDVMQWHLSCKSILSVQTLFGAAAVLVYFLVAVYVLWMALVLCSPAHEWGLHTDSGYPHESLHCPHNLAFVLTLVWSRAVFVSSLCPACVHFQGDISLPCLLLCFLLSLKFSSVILAFFQVNEKRGQRDWCVWRL